MCFHDSDLCSQVSGEPVCVRNLIRQATVHLGGEETGQDGGEEDDGEAAREEDETTEIKITVLILTMAISFCLIILVFYLFPGHFSETFIFVFLIVFLVMILTGFWCWVCCCYNSQ